MKQRSIRQNLFTLALGGIACAATTAVLMGGTPAQAQITTQNSTTVTIKGKVYNYSCTPIVNDNNPVVLPDISVLEIPGLGDTAGTVSFPVTADCNYDFDWALPLGTKAYFYASHVQDGRLNLLSSSEGSGWQYQLLPASMDDQLDVKTSPIASDNPEDLGNAVDSGTLRYAVRYYRSSLANFNPGQGISEVNAVLLFP